jgi:murein DD-endopeptidase MepM/ murein hydrolase activator NlpD
MAKPASARFMFLLRRRRSRQNSSFTLGVRLGIMRFREIAPATQKSAPILVFLVSFCALPLHAQKCSVSPRQVKLGDTLRVSCPAEFTTAKLFDRNAKLYSQANGLRFGLLAISVKDKPGAYAVTVSSTDSRQTQSLPIVIRTTIFPSQNVKLSAEIEALHSTPEELALLTTFKDTISETRSWVDPLAPPVSGCMTSPFGVKRLHNGKPTGEYHGGVDQRSPEGEAIRAVAAGAVTFAKQFNVLGNAVGIDHGQGLQSMYLHMTRLVVASGATVQRGDILGYAGSTGRSTGPHLHWVLYANGINVNPAQWIKLQPCPRPPKGR